MFCQMAQTNATVVRAETNSAFTTAVLYTKNTSSELPAAVQNMVNRLRKFTNVLPIPIQNQLDFDACLEQVDVVVNMLSGFSQLPVMYIGSDPSQGIVSCATKTTHMFNFAVDETAPANSSALEERTDILCRK